MNKTIFIFLASLALSLPAGAQTQGLRQKAERELNAYFVHYQAKEAYYERQPRMKKLNIDNKKKTVEVVMDASFAQQSFTKRQVRKIYKKVKSALPKPYNKYDIKVLTNGLPIEDYVPGHESSDRSYAGLWGNIEYDDEPWVQNVSKLNKVTHGLYDRHLTIWASHGRYYDNEKGRWKWQRPNLFGTTEDLFTQTIVVPYLIPMLENAGAVVFTPRERDWQTHEYIVDPDGCLNASAKDYDEYAEGRQWTSTGLRGFAARAGHYVDNTNPFEAGSARMIKATKRDGKAYVKYQPTFKEAGRYAVYVSYQTVDKSVDDAHYTVFHKGQATEFRVNQRMGGGTWVYLGTFDFDKGNNIYNCVMLTNQSHRRGVVTADAVRFGGGMGNIERGGTVSGYPRALEGARYSAQWAGAPYVVYSGRGGTEDYADDINVRSRMLNWLAGGSVYVPTLDGKNVPMELSLAVHSDAGFSPNGTDLIGSLAICTTNFNDGRLSSGVTRQASKRFADALLTNVTRDMSQQFGAWNRRYLWDRNYSETRLPEVPSAILETMSHQNFPDMLKGQDPNFRFAFARSVYKTILRYVSGMHKQPCIVQPLPPRNLSVELVGDNKARLSWSAQEDEYEPTAVPTSYNVYVAAGSAGFDNGTNVKSTSMTIDIQPGVQYNFRVTAVNRGGESFPSEVVSTCAQPGARQTVLVVNGFTRLSGPAVINNSTEQGFDLDADIGVSYGLTAGWNGKQICFDRSQMGKEGPGGLGYGGDELAGHFIMGNEFNYTVDHVDAIAACKKYNVVSCSLDALNSGKVKPQDFAALDLYLGLQKYSAENTHYYKTFSSSLKNILNSYTHSGGRLFVSGAYVGSDMTVAEDSLWLAGVCKSDFVASLKADTLTGVHGLGMQFDFYKSLNANHYAAQHVDALQPQAGAICAMQYSSGAGAAVAYQGADYRAFVMGFPFECILDRTTRQRLMRGVMDYLLNPTNNH
jgi:hypothetical protein